MNRRVYTQHDLATMDKGEFEMVCMCLRFGTLRLLGMAWQKWIRCWQEMNGDLVFEWK